MIKARTGKIIMVTPAKNSIFEQAYFLVKPGIYEVDIEESEMVTEADRIISQSLLFRSRNKNKRQKNKPCGAALFAAGLVAGIAICLFSLYIFSNFVL